MNDNLRAFYTTPGIFTSLGRHAAAFDDVPADVARLAQHVQLLLLHRSWAKGYQVDPPPERGKEETLHSAEALLDCALRLSEAPLASVRLPAKRVLCICRHFTVLMVALLRSKNIPARARCGFATYFDPGKRVDHWVSEYWNDAESRWVLVDAQLDALQVAVIKPDFSPLDVPRDRFLVAGDAWGRVRSGEVAGDTFGIFDMWGDWYIVGNVGHDLASLLNIELLPWEPYGIFADKTPDTAAMALFERIAALTALADDAAIEELRTLVAATPSLRVPPQLIARCVEGDAAGGSGKNPIPVSS
jgi:hypothetical protein